MPVAHMVTFQTPDGTPGFHQSDTLDEAITFVERLRNEQGVHNSRIFRMEELTFDFKPYYKVEIAADSGEMAPATPRAVPSTRPAEPSSGRSLDLSDEIEEAAAKSVPDTPASAAPAGTTPLPPPPPAPEVTPEPAPASVPSGVEESSEPPRRGLFTR